MDETRLTPEQARERFGELTVPAGSNRVHAHFDGPDGAEWRPEFDQNMKLVGYRLFRFRKPGGRKVSFRPKGIGSRGGAGERYLNGYALDYKAHGRPDAVAHVVIVEPPSRLSLALPYNQCQKLPYGIKVTIAACIHRTCHEAALAHRPEMIFQ